MKLQYWTCVAANHGMFCTRTHTASFLVYILILKVCNRTLKSESRRFHHGNNLQTLLQA